MAKLAINDPPFQYTHFVSLPLSVHPMLAEQLTAFQKSVMALLDIYDQQQVDKGFGIEKSIFIKPSTFHLTVLMLKLWNKERVDAAMKVLEQTRSQVFDVLEGRPVMITLKGLECMNGPPAKARVLYARVEDQGNRLLQACYVIINAFVEPGLVLVKDQKQSKQLKLHATIMNSSYRSKKSKFKNESFDATELVEKYGLHIWGEYQILEAHLSERFKYDTNGYYHCCSSIPFPKSEN